MNKKFDFAIVGAGVIGLAIGCELLKRDPKLKVIILEKEDKAGQHASGRNSGVIHAGFYYSPDSLKAKLTRDGNFLIKEFADKRKIQYRVPGKVVVATNEDQKKLIIDLHDRGIENNVKVKIISKQDLLRIEPKARTHDIALWSPDTGIGEPNLFMMEFVAEFLELGGSISYSSEVKNFSTKYLDTNVGKIQFNHLVNASGLYADRIAHQFGYGLNYIMMPFLGLYLYAPNLRGALRTHIYPTPDPRNPFLGVHFTITLDGSVKLGPTAIPLLSREQYSGFSGFKLNEFAELLRHYPKFLFSPHHDVFSLIRTEIPKISKRTLIKQAINLTEGINLSLFNTWGKPGIRAQLYNKVENKLEMDFVVEGDKRSTHILNAVSPGWTSCISFAKYVCDVMNENQAA